MKEFKVQPGEKFVLPMKVVVPRNVLVLGWEREITNTGKVEVNVREDGLWAKSDGDGEVLVVDKT